MPTEHIVTSFDDELKRLKNHIIRMGGIAEAQVASAIKAISRRDVELASRIVQNDAQIDEIENEVENDVVRILALRQPMGPDLREAISALKIASDLERIGDYAANAAKRAIAISTSPPVNPVAGIPVMGRLVREIIDQVLDAYIKRDTAIAMQAWHRDEELDELYTGMFRELLTYMMEDPRNISTCTHLLFVAKNFERMGDHATNVAETIYFLVEGKHLREERPKGDQTSYTAVSSES